MSTTLALLIILSAATTWAAPAPLQPQRQAPPQLPKAHTVQRQIGGQAGSGFSLLGLQKVQSKTGKAERLIFEVGTKEGKALMGVPGYFNAQNQINPNRIVIDFSQMSTSRVDLDSIRTILKDSGLVSNVRMTSDPSDQTLSLVLDLKSRVNMKTLQVAGKKQTAKVVIDLVRK